MSTSLFLVPRSNETDVERLMRISINTFRSELGSEAASLLRKAFFGMFLQGVLQFSLGPLGFTYTAASAANLLYKVVEKTYNAYKRENIRLGSEYCIYKKNSILIAEKTREVGANTLTTPDKISWELAPTNFSTGINLLTDIPVPFNEHFLFDSHQQFNSALFGSQDYRLESTFNVPIVFDKPINLAKNSFLHSIRSTNQDFDFNYLSPFFITENDSYKPIETSVPAINLNAYTWQPSNIDRKYILPTNNEPQTPNPPSLDLGSNAWRPSNIDWKYIHPTNNEPQIPNPPSLGLGSNAWRPSNIDWKYIHPTNNEPQTLNPPSLGLGSNTWRPSNIDWKYILPTNNEPQIPNFSNLDLGNNIWPQLSNPQNISSVGEEKSWFDKILDFLRDIFG